ncbi:C39 family peptidase [Anaerovibrio sp.]|uniref:C39 family peptidase n=1 Tax=Anaerovibrio sp. TaxID=1872532 RepID=UPI0038902FFA
MKKNGWKNLLFAGLVSSSLFFGSTVEAGVVTDRLPLQCYADHQVNTYNSPGAPKRAGYISANVDLIQITQVRGDGWCYGSYPGARGKRVSRWFRITDVCADAGYTNRSVNVKGKQTVYRTSSGGTTLGSVSNNEGVIVVADNGSRAQIVYRLDNGSGYKLGWVPSSSVQPPVQSHNPEGYFDIGVSNKANNLTVQGWAFDRDNVNEKLRIHVYIGGGAGSGAEGHEIVANKRRADVQTGFARRDGINVGEYHGFDETISTNRTGRQEVYVYAINVGGGGNVELGHKTVDINSVNEQDGYIKTNGARVNLRGTPNGTIIDKINNGTAVKILAHNNPSGWSKIKYNGREGYASSQYVVIDNISHTPVNNSILNVMLLKQTDSRWKNTKIGTKTIGAVGCMVTSLTMKYNYHNHTNITPADMVKKLKFSNNDLLWSSVDSLGYTKELVTNKPALNNIWMSKIYSQLKNGKPVIVGAYRGSGQHWIVVKGYNGSQTNNFNASNFSINDPMNSFTNLQQFINRYNNGLRGIVY